MALVSGGRSTLNPNAPLFIPAAVRQVEDFSPDWWNLVTTSTWFRDYWINQNQGGDVFGDAEVGDDVIGMLPDTIDLCVDDDILNMEEQFEEFLQSSGAEYGNNPQYGYGNNAGAIVKSPRMANGAVKSPREPVKYWEKPAKHVSPRCSPRFIHQPR